MTTTYTFPSTPIAGGTINTVESIWLGGTRFFMVFDQTSPNYEIAAIFDASGDLYTSGTTLNATTQIVTKANSYFTQPVKLLKLSSSTILCFYTNTLTASNTSSPTTLTLNARVYSIDSSNNITVVYDGTNVVPASFLNNYTVESAPYTSTSSLNVGAVVSRYPQAWSQSAFCSPVDNHICAVSRDFTTASGNYNLSSGNSYPYVYTSSYWDITWTASTSTLAISKWYTSASISEYPFSLNTASSVPPLAPCHALTIAVVPGTTLILVGDNLYNTYQASMTATSDATALTNSTGYYTCDYTSTSASRTVVAAVRTGAILLPLDSTRLLEIPGSTINSVRYCRINTSGTWSGDIPFDTSLVTSNNNLAAAFSGGPPQQALALGADHILMAFGWAAFSSTGTNFFSAYGIFRLIGTSFLQAAPYGQPTPASAQIFYRNADAYIPRQALDGSTASAYDLYRKQAGNSHLFLRYTNPS